MLAAELCYRCIGQEICTVIYQNGSRHGKLYQSSFLLARYGFAIEQKRFKRTSPFKQPTREEKMQQRAKYDPHTKSLIDHARTIESEKISPVVDTIGFIASPYVPTKQKPPIYTKKGLEARWEAFKKTLTTTYSIAIIRKNVKPFKVKDFAKYVQMMFIDTNTAVEKNDEIKLQELATTNVYMALLKEFNSPLKKIHWRFIQEVERPRIVHASISPVGDKNNLFAQVTIRMCSEQILAIKDNYGRTMRGDDRKSKKVTDYVVVERHLTNPYGQWRICGKITPQVPAALKDSSNKVAVS